MLAETQSYRRIPQFDHISLRCMIAFLNRICSESSSPSQLSRLTMSRRRWDRRSKLLRQSECFVCMPRLAGNADTCRCRLSQMILDKILYGVLDQGRRCLLVFDGHRCTLLQSCFFFGFVYLDSEREHIWHCDRYAGTGGQSRRVVVCKGKSCVFKSDMS